jgi:hypothetical protein
VEQIKEGFSFANSANSAEYREQCFSALINLYSKIEKPVLIGDMLEKYFLKTLCIYHMNKDINLPPSENGFFFFFVLFFVSFI